MDDNYECTKKEFDASIADQQWFYAKSKVPICLAITECLPFLHDLNDAGFLSEEESLELQADTRSDHRIIYECLCCIEEKNINLKHFFEHLFKKSYLNKYPDLRPILQEYTEDRSGNSTSSTVDMDTDYLIFAQEKVPICLAITDCFPFLHGLQDLTILSETESLKLQADERPVSRVIYECLSVIQKKDMKLNVVFEYIFQQCYLKVYPALQDMLQGPNEDQSRPFNGRQFPVFTRPGDLLDFFEHNKAYICEAIDERFPILHGLHDKGLLSRLQLLKLQADRRLTNEVLYQALCLIDQQDNIEMFFAYVFQEYYLELYPDLNTILQNLNDALKLEIYPPSPVSCSDQVSELQEQESSGPSTDSIRQSDHLEDNTSVLLGSTDEYPDLDYNWMPIRKCRMKPINYTEPPDYDLEHVNGKKRHKAPEHSLQRRLKKRRSKETKFRTPEDRNCELATQLPAETTSPNMDNTMP
ncbi:uncharacterized protein LOC142132485 isoform X2 [Mixophyes fleayi]|uniref:uncharacterized protein LOC142132485 isoform X2 n=1 Tax=Mixophyes fleayi TaxID=3061075 RepID=UPI003F4DFD4A